MQRAPTAHRRNVKCHDVTPPLCPLTLIKETKGKSAVKPRFGSWFVTNCHTVSASFANIEKVSGDW
jgi:hypothetical protein